MKLKLDSLTVGYNGIPLISDITLSLAKGEIMTLKPREVAIFFPETGAHAPCLSLTGPRTIRKVVIKVRK